MFSRILKLSEEYVWVAEVAVGSSLGRLVAELSRYLQPLRVEADGAGEVAEEVACVAQVPTRATHRLPVAEAAHQLEILPEEWVRKEISLNWYTFMLIFADSSYTYTQQKK